MTLKRRFLSVLLVDLPLPVTLIRIPGGEVLPFNEFVKTLVHAWQMVRIPKLHSVELSVIDTEAQHAIFLGDEQHWCLPFRHGWCDDAILQLVNNFSAFELTIISSSTELWSLERLGIHYQVNAHFCDIALTQFPGLSLLVLLQNRSNFILFIIWDVYCDVFGGYRRFIFTHMLLAVTGKMLVYCFDFMRTRVSLWKLSIPIVGY